MASANQLIGKLLRDLRKQRNMKGEELGRLVGMSQSKVSKLESGLYPHLAFKEIERILNILNAPRSTRQRIYRAMDGMQPKELRLVLDTVQYSKDSNRYALKTTSTRTFSPFVVPHYLQTNEYRLALMKFNNANEQDIDIVKALAQRQNLLWDTNRQFHFIMHQTALYGSLPGKRGLDLSQIDRIERFMSLSHIKIGIIPLEAGMPQMDLGPFALLDDHTLVRSIVGGDLRSTDGKSIALHEQIFDHLSQLAVYGEEAKRLLRLAVEYAGSE